MKHRTQILPSVCIAFTTACCAQGTTDNSSIDPRLYGLIPDQKIAQLPTVTVHATLPKPLDTTTATHTTPAIPVSPGELNTRVTGLARAFDPPAVSGGLSVQFVRVPLSMPTQIGVTSLASQTRTQLQTPAPVSAVTPSQQPTVRALAAPPGSTPVTATGPGRFGNAAAMTLLGLDKQPVAPDFSAMPNTSNASSVNATNNGKLRLRPGGGGVNINYTASF